MGRRTYVSITCWHEHQISPIPPVRRCRPEELLKPSSDRYCAKCNVQLALRCCLVSLNLRRLNKAQSAEIERATKMEERLKWKGDGNCNLNITLTRYFYILPGLCASPQPLQNMAPSRPPRSFSALTFGSGHRNISPGPPSPTFSDATHASAMNFGSNGPEKIITRANLKASLQAYEEVSVHLDRFSYHLNPLVFECNIAC
jgi:hypothetical protein